MELLDEPDSQKRTAVLYEYVEVFLPFMIKDGVGMYLVGRPTPAFSVSLVFKPNFAKFVFYLKSGKWGDK